MGERDHVRARDDEHVALEERLCVEKGDGVLVAVDDRRGRRAFDDSAEDAGHGCTLQVHHGQAGRSAGPTGPDADSLADARSCYELHHARTSPWSARRTRRARARRSCGSSTARRSIAMPSRIGAGEHGYRVPDFAGARPARLEGFRLAFDVQSRFWVARRASLREAPGESVEGLAPPMAGDARGLVDHKEGAISGLYTMFPVELVALDDGARILRPSPIARPSRRIASCRRRAGSSRRWSRARAARSSARRGLTVCRGFFDVVGSLAEDHPQGRRQRREVGDHRQHEGQQDKMPN